MCTIVLRNISLAIVFQSEVSMHIQWVLVGSCKAMPMLVMNWDCVTEILQEIWSLSVVL